jgi:mannosyltransferase OCH1-like enzyme
MHLNDNKIINSLWIGNYLSKIELLTINSFVNNGHEFHLWVYDKINTNMPKGVCLKDANMILPGEKIFRYKFTNQFGHGKESLAGFSDIFRYKLLYEYGGWWVDMDICCLKHFDFSAPYVFRTHHILPAVGSIMKCPEKSQLMHLCYESAYKNINKFNTDWHKPLTILNDNIKKLKLSDYIVDISNQDNLRTIRKLITKSKQIPDNWYAIHWANENWRTDNINKNYFKEKSSLGILMNKNNITSDKINLWGKIKNKIKLSWVYAVSKQIKVFIKFHF